MDSMVISKKKNWHNFSELYQVSKTLRFELKPDERTLNNMRKHLRYDEKLQTFLADQEIKNAYNDLKPVFDYLHEQFITESLESRSAKEVNFSEYLKKYRDEGKDLENSEKVLREAFLKLYEETATAWKRKAGKNGKGKDLLTEKGFKVLTENGILEYIKNNSDALSIVKPSKKIEEALGKFRGFFTYFVGFNQNRENYYETKKEASTAVASRVVHENLPKFCDNILAFENNQGRYLNAYQALQSAGKTLETKDGKTLSPITKDIFFIQHFNQCLSQSQIETYNDKLGNANFLINLYNQANKNKKLSLFKKLYKQIGCGTRSALFFALTHEKKIESDKARMGGKEAFSVEEVLILAHKASEKYFKATSYDEIINTLPELVEYISTRDNYFGFYWSKTAINTISSKYFANWYELMDRLKEAKIFKKADKGSEENVKIPEAVELEGFFQVINETPDWKKSLFKTSVVEDKEKDEIIKQSPSASSALLSLIFNDIENHSKHFHVEAEKILKLEKYSGDKEKQQIKEWLDDTLAVTRILKYFLVKETKARGAPIDSTLSLTLDEILFGEDVEWFKWYDAVRNFLTKKPQDDAKENKLKLNFGNSTLASGWDVNKEPDNYCVIFKDPEGNKFLGVIARHQDQQGYNKIFEKRPDNPLYDTHAGRSWKKMEYKLLPGPNKMLPKCLLPKSNPSKYGASPAVLRVYYKKSFRKNEDSFSLSSLHVLIDFYKSALQKYEDWQCFNFSFGPTKSYQDISQFYSEVEKQGYKLDFVDINKSVLDDYVERGKMYLFEVKNQDFNLGKQDNHRDNLHTTYWNALFENVQNRPKLNGEAEIFYRKAIPSEKLEKTERGAIKGYRFSKEKFLFHVPITLNFCLKNMNIGEKINKTLKETVDVHFLGIDRGEKHLAYYSLINQNGKILKQGSFNNIGGKDYNELLEKRAVDRSKARQNWQTIGTIKKLKDGYISQVVRKIADLAVQHNAYIVLENLNTGFKRGRQKIEKSVYQKLELALAKKLNFLVDKTAKIGEVGSVTKALQLTPPVNNYSDIERRPQVGIMLYVRANYTSQTDPITGWRKTIYLNSGSQEAIKDQIIKVFKDISFDGKDYVFTYTNQSTGKEWKLYSGKDGKSLDRFRARKISENSWKPEKYDIVVMLNKLFEGFDKNRSFLSQIVDKGAELTKVKEGGSAWESLRFAIDRIQQIRNTGTAKEDNDFLVSPARDENGNHYDSRNAKQDEPDCGDANGAYNIARKGIVASEHIRRGYKLYVSDEEWDAWLSGKKNWEVWLRKNEEKVKK